MAPSGPAEALVNGAQHREGTPAAAGQVTELPGCGDEHLRIGGVLEHPLSGRA